MKLALFRRARKSKEPEIRRKESQFYHGHTSESGFASVCLRCFKTVGTGERESELDWAEQEHVCVQPIGSA